MMDEAPHFELACPACRTPLRPGGAEELCCPRDGFSFRRQDGIWRMLLPEREAQYRKFVDDYETIRKAEGRGSPDPAYYRALPYQDLSGQLRADWRIRAASFDELLRRVALPAEKVGRRLRTLDLGAGNGWLSNRLRLRGHALAAVDLLVNDFDGLGCHTRYAAPFLPLQAEFDRLPLADGSSDLVIFNASFHYSTRYDLTLGEACRVLAKDGQIVILDTPLYTQRASGETMLREREAQFTQRYGFPSNALPSEGFLTYARLGELAASLKLSVKLYTPFYGVEWLLRPLKARLLGRREPARFHLMLFTRTA